ncbi:MAG TPA: formate dehydrogenase accessory sulfurtransferase FdhD [Desulfotomaculum sp.]|nr:MAG: Protein FdhD-like protein [Desulfotomaculum sp. 46_80]HAG10526.1 formate dehydrogenase accessory sulfurtransferase FdhD [Desulfotomaculum sp.]HBY04051.1 formate dehydrogenase accessory sulfurtransferase FdhD [Desulfotomaculum sp.]
MMPTSKVVIETTEVDSKKSTVLQDVVVKERQVNLLFNGYELGVIDGIQDSLRELALGFLFTEGYLRRKDELKRIFLSDNSSLLMVETLAYEPKEEDFTRPIGASSKSRWPSLRPEGHEETLNPVVSDLVVSYEQVISLNLQFDYLSVLLASTRATHGAALCTNSKIIRLFEDISRFNAMDKVVGFTFFEEIPPSDKLIFFSGRISSGIITKLLRIGVPVIVSRDYPTDQAIELAREKGITTVGAVKDDKFIIYTHGERVDLGSKAKTCF